MTFRDGAWVHVRLTRPTNLIIVAISIAVGAAVSGALSPARLVAAIASGVLVAAGGNTANDLFDREIDRVNRPDRPVAAGLVSPRAALLSALVLLAAGWIVSAGVGMAGFVLVSSWLVLLTAYSSFLKRRGPVGNLVVSAVSASAFLLGGLAARSPALSLIPAGLAFLFHRGREIVKDVQDLPGDSPAGVRSLAVRYGRDRALAAAAVVFVLLIAVTPLPFVTGVYNLVYLAAVVVGVDLPLVYVIGAILSKPSGEKLGRVSALLKADMVVGIGSILAGCGVWV